MPVDQDKLMDFLHKFVGDLGATMAAGNVVVGDRLGLYRALAQQPMRPDELAQQTGTATRYIDEWLRGQAAGGYVEYDPQDGTYSLTPEQAFALTDPDGAVYAPGAFQLALGALRAEPQGSAGTSTTRRCSPGASGSSGPGTRPIWCPAGCPPSTEPRLSSAPGPGSPTSAAASALPPS
jgi:hypothetical protein